MLNFKKFRHKDDPQICPKFGGHIILSVLFIVFI